MEDTTAPTLYLHIGIPKTGTTSIQNFLFANRDRLDAHGFHWPQSMTSRNHRVLCVYSLDDTVVDNTRKAAQITTPEKVQAFRAEFAPRFRADALTWPADRSVVLTSEQLFRVTRPSEFERLRDLLQASGRRIVVGVYLRRQDLYFTSEYSQVIKGGTDAEFVPPSNMAEQKIYNYATFLKRWAAAFDRENIIVRVFERGAMAGGDAVQDFCATVGLQGFESLEQVEEKNQSLDAAALEFLRRIAPFFPRFVNGKVNKVRLKLIEALEEISDGARPQLPAKDARKLMKMFEESNAEVARTYLDRSDGILFREKISPSEGTMPTLSVDAAVSIAGRLMNRML